MKLSLAVTTYERVSMTIESFSQVLDDSRVSEVVVLDDHSSWDTWQKLLEAMPKHDKIQVYSTPENIGMSENKKRVIDLASNEWVIILDSDNVIDSSYLDALEKWAPFYKKDIYCPSFAKPNFDYREITGISKDTIKKDLQRKNTAQFLNTCNYVVNRKFYLECWQKNKEVGECDTIWFNYLFLKQGGKLLTVPGMEYFHRVHENSGWMKNRKKNVEKFKEIKKMIENL